MASCAHIRWWCYAAATLLLLAVDTCTGQGLRTLVVLESWSTKQTHSSFFAELKERGHELDYRLPNDPKLALQTYGEYIYDNLIIFGSDIAGFGGSLSVPSILRYLDHGHNLLVAVDHHVSPKMRELANQCGIDFDPKDIRLHDHQHYDVSDTRGDHTLVVTDTWIEAPVLTGAPKAPVLYRGVAAALDVKSKLVFSILQGSPTVVASSIKRSSKIHSMGKDSNLITALQGRNNARATFVGSVDMCSDAFYASPVQRAGTNERFEKSGNEDFCVALGKWTFKETGLLRATNVRHHIANNATILNPAVYTVNDFVDYSVDISEWSWESQTWVPFTKTDVQLELVKMSPYQLKNMDTSKKGRYTAQIQLPHEFGVYHFTIDYKRRGFSHLQQSDQIAVRPYRHSEHARFIPAAYPYYSSAFSLIAAFATFGVLFLYQKEK